MNAQLDPIVFSKTSGGFVKIDDPEYLFQSFNKLQVLFSPLAYMLGFRPTVSPLDKTIQIPDTNTIYQVGLGGGNFPGSGPFSTTSPCLPQLNIDSFFNMNITNIHQ